MKKCTFQPTQPMVSAAIRRPRFNISVEQLSCLVENRFTVPQMADMLRTLHRRLAENGLSICNQYSSIPDSELDSIVSQVHDLFPMCGNSQMEGHLLAHWLRIQQSRIREAQRRVDLDSCMMRRLTTINHRQYSVHSPRSLYHTDGNHKLIRCCSYF